MVAGVTEQHRHNCVDELPDHEHGLAIAWSENARQVVQETAPGFLDYPSVARHIFLLLYMLLLPEEDLKGLKLNV